MSDSKASSPIGDGVDPKADRLVDKAPPKPRRRGSSIPAALVTSTTASKIPPAPRPPRPPTRVRPAETAPVSSTPKSSRPKSSRPKSARTKSRVIAADRLTESPVSATPTESAQGQKHSGAAWVWLAAAGVLAGGVWLYQERSNPHAEPTSPAATGQHAARVLSDEQALENPATVVRTNAPSRPLNLDDEAKNENAAANAPQAPVAAPPAAATERNDVPSKGTTSTATADATPSAEPSTNEAKKSDSNDALSAEPAAAADADNASGSKSADSSAAEPAVELPPFDAQAAKNVLGDRAVQASSCRRGNDPKGTAEVIVTFAPSGRVTSANVAGEPYGGTATGGCIASTMRRATVPAFSGKYVTVRKLVHIR